MSLGVSAFNLKIRKYSRKLEMNFFVIPMSENPQVPIISLKIPLLKSGNFGNADFGTFCAATRDFMRNFEKLSRRGDRLKRDLPFLTTFVQKGF
jgi:hypothetical protein